MCSAFPAWKAIDGAGKDGTNGENWPNMAIGQSKAADLVVTIDESSHLKYVKLWPRTDNGLSKYSMGKNEKNCNGHTFYKNE